MKSVRQFWVCGIALVASICFAKAQTDSSTDFSAGDVATMLQALEEGTPTPAASLPEFGTFWSAQHAPGLPGAWPPLPGNTLGLDAWPMGDNHFVLNDTNVDYNAVAAAAASPNGRFHADDGGPDLPGGGSGGGTNDTFGSDFTMPDYGTNLWIAMVGISNNSVGLLLSNTVADVLYEIQSTTNLVTPNWTSQGFVDGSELTNWTPASVFAGQPGNLFLRIRSWADSTGSGIPDWWWLYYFDQITNVDAYASAEGDGYSNLQKFQMGLDPTNYYNPNPPGGFFGGLDIAGTNAVIEWSPAPGPVVNYAIQRGIEDMFGNYAFSQIGLVSSNATFFVDVGAITNANAQNNAYNLQAVYPGDSLSATDTWTVSDYANSGSFGPPAGPPLPGNVYAYADSTGTNVLISWTAPTQGVATNYIVVRGVYDSDIGSYDYSQIATVSTNTTYFYDVGGITNADYGNYMYEVEAIFPGSAVSAPAAAYISTTPPSPTGIVATVDPTGTNVLISWMPPQGIAVTNYVIWRGVYNTNTSRYDFSQIGQVNAGITSFEDAGAITNSNNLNNIYEVEAIFPDGGSSEFDEAVLPGPPAPPAVVNANIYITAYLVRNGSGRWQIMFSGAPTNAQTIQLTWTDVNGNATPQDISTSNLTNGVYSIPDAEVVNLLGDSLSVQLFGPNGEPGQVAQAGVLANDAPYFVDGRQHMKQNLNFLIRAAEPDRPYMGANNMIVLSENYNQKGTNFEEFSFLHHVLSASLLQLDNLWPFSQNYHLANFIIDTSTYTNRHPWADLEGDTALGTEQYSFNFTPNFATNIPAPPILTGASPYLINQLEFYWPELGGFGPYPELTGVSISDDLGFASATLPSGSTSLFGFPYETGCLINRNYYTNSDPLIFQTFAPGTTENVSSEENAEGYIEWVGYASQCAAPTLVFSNYYFAPISNTNADTMNLQGVGSASYSPVPIDDNFSVTNQTPALIVATVGQPMILGGWANYAIQNGSTPTGKFAYLGQYFATNAFLLDGSGDVTTNSAGVLSPYGEFFPLQAGQAELVTMSDIDPPYEQGTGVVDIISLNVDANHDGTMDFSYTGPDQNSPSRPFRFWANDDLDSGDDGGDGIPGVLPTYVNDGNNILGDVFAANPFPGEGLTQPFYGIRGRRDLVDYFPVYLNIGSLFQSNALSAGISIDDTNYQFYLIQNDGVLRFFYTDLTPTNYMSFLRDTNESGSLLNQRGLGIYSWGYTPLDRGFLAGIVTNNQGIILVEAATNTTQPLMLQVFKGTNLIAQSSLYLDISGVEQMFRSKTMVLTDTNGTVPDRLTDASVPNEPDTIDKNFVFVHGYNVNPQQARGWNADYYKRLYWSGSHAKFYGVTWEASDSQVDGQVTINLQTNIVNAFNTAPLLNTFLNSLSGTNVVAAHSLGNMLVLSTLNDCSNQNINTYFMIDAAVAIEAIDTNAPLNSDMYPSAWTNYESGLWGSKWFNLWPSNDARSTLTWSGRLQNLQNASVYNFYSSGEEVLRDYPNDPPTSLHGIAGGQLVSLWEGDTGEYTWAWQEKLKGLMQVNFLLSSDHGGWQFNEAYGTNIGTAGTILYQHMSPSAAAELTATQLQTNAFFNFASGGLLPFNNDLALETSSGNSYAQANRNRILSDAIPCLNLPLGANHDTNLDLEFGETRNFDMQTLYENGWPLGRGPAQYPVSTPAAGEWHHSDNRAVAYTFTYQFFNKMVTLGNLK